MDLSLVAADAHNCPACPHPAVGPATTGSTNVMVNGSPALRMDDHGIHAACCGPNSWTAIQGSATVLVNGKGAHRLGDQAQHCGGIGVLITASANVVVGGTAACSVAQDKKRFGSAEEAAVDAMKEANPKSIKEGREYAGWVHKNADGSFSTAPSQQVQGDKVSGFPPKGPSDVAWWHTHGANDSGHDNESFSGNKDVSRANNAPGYMATPTGVIKRYDPDTDKVTTLPDRAPTS